MVMKKNDKKNQLEEKLNIAYQKGKELKAEGASEKELNQNKRKVARLENKLIKVNNKISSSSELDDVLNPKRKIESTKRKEYLKTIDNEEGGVTAITEKIQDNQLSTNFTEDEAIDKIIISNSMERINTFILNENRLNVLEAAECKLFLLKVNHT